MYPCKRFSFAMKTSSNFIFVQNFKTLRNVTKCYTWYQTWNDLSFWSTPAHSISLRSVLILSCHLRLGLPSCFFPSGFQLKCYMFSSLPKVLRLLRLSVAQEKSFDLGSTDPCESPTAKNLWLKTDFPPKSQRPSAKAIRTLWVQLPENHPTKIIFTKDKLPDGIISHQ
jgi:hypothetical protein